MKREDKIAEDLIRDATCWMEDYFDEPLRSRQIRALAHAAAKRLAALERVLDSRTEDSV
jgi:hypothetical protein